jgi:hypothetical protein
MQWLGVTVSACFNAPVSALTSSFVILLCLIFPLAKTVRPTTLSIFISIAGAFMLLFSLGLLIRMA